MKLENKQIGISIAVILAIGMLFVRVKPERTYQPDLLAERICGDNDAIYAPKLAHWLIEGNKNFTLVDLRTRKETRKGKLPKAINIPLAEFFAKDMAKQFTTDVVVLYSQNSSQAAQAIMLLKMLEKPEQKTPKWLYLEGGFRGWSGFGKKSIQAMPVEQGFSPKNPEKKIDLKPVRLHEIEEDEGC